MNAMLILIHETIDARDRAIKNDDFEGVKVFNGFIGPDTMDVKRFDPESGVIDGVLFTHKDAFTAHTSKVQKLLEVMNSQDERRGCRCLSAYRVELSYSNAIYEHAAIDFLEENEEN